MFCLVVFSLQKYFVILIIDVRELHSTKPVMVPEQAVAVMTAPQPPTTPKSAQQASVGRVPTNTATLAKATLDAQEQKRWWQLEEVSHTFMISSHPSNHACICLKSC